MSEAVQVQRIQGPQRIIQYLTFVKILYLLLEIVIFDRFFKHIKLKRFWVYSQIFVNIFNITFGKTDYIKYRE